MRSTPEASKAALAEAAERVLLEAGLSGLSLDRVAREAGCAKGLVNYHFRTKGDLLAAVAARLAARRRERLLTAAQGVGAAALDGLWDSVRKAAASGESAGRFALLGLADPAIALPLADLGANWHPLSDQLGKALDAPPLDPESVLAFLATLDGLELALLAGAPEEECKAGYYRAILALTD